ncbi:MAG: hypothetical protein JKY82_05370 [Rhizobiaceae bacterium]|nr:hypothetical protein [Rhizobiaceae bacterium]MBL4695827.1 hypothetical protein [Rhizobiaceae bacterium]MBL4732016.1 hypothetical protein [Rhizobiaceae bacterium]
MLTNVPLMIVPFITYNIVSWGLIGDASSDPWQQVVLAVPMVSGAIWSMSLGDVMITLSLLLLFFEILKATRIGADSIIDHLLSTFVLIAFLVEFLLVENAAHPVFFILMVITFVDVIAGFSVSIRSATRDVTLGGGLH